MQKMTAWQRNRSEKGNVVFKKWLHGRGTEVKKGNVVLKKAKQKPPSTIRKYIITILVLNWSQDVHYDL